MTALLKKRIPSLDGMRAASILMVIIGHAFGKQIRCIDFANLGVLVFFIISAYLIVGILSNDVAKGRFSVGSFYFKRLTRTLPAFYIYLIIVFFLLRSLSLFDWQQFMPSVFFLEDYHPRYLWNDRQWFTGHTWSLAVEEQFYFLIAFVFLFLNKKIITEKQVLNILVMIVFLVPLIRISYMFINAIPEFLRGSLHRSFETVADSLAVGGILALRQEKIIRSQIFLFFKNKIWLLILIIMLLQMCNSSWTVATFGLAPRYFYNLIGLCGVNICTGLLLLHVIHFSGENAFAKFLNTPVMIKIGLWSYSIYLWQQVWLYTWDMPLAYKLAGILICSVASYYLIEKTVLAWRDGVISRQKFRRYSCQ